MYNSRKETHESGQWAVCHNCVLRVHKHRVLQWFKLSLFPKRAGHVIGRLFDMRWQLDSSVKTYVLNFIVKILKSGAKIAQVLQAPDVQTWVGARESMLRWKERTNYIILFFDVHTSFTIIIINSLVKIYLIHFESWLGLLLDKRVIKCISKHCF